ncbi:MAG: hypothetical protein QXT25_01385 [Candidatus Anstonellaceae archaeon]
MPLAQEIKKNDHLISQRGPEDGFLKLTKKEEDQKQKTNSPSQTPSVVIEQKRQEIRVENKLLLVDENGAIFYNGKQFNLNKPTERNDFLNHLKNDGILEEFLKKAREHPILVRIFYEEITESKRDEEIRRRQMENLTILFPIIQEIVKKNNDQKNIDKKNEEQKTKDGEETGGQA